jgi:hypothetical protein
MKFIILIAALNAILFPLKRESKTKLTSETLCNFVIRNLNMYKNSLKDMRTLTRELKDMIKTPCGFVGTVNADGTPNLAPKRSPCVL